MAVDCEGITGKGFVLSSLFETNAASGEAVAGFLAFPVMIWFQQNNRVAV